MDEKQFITDEKQRFDSISIMYKQAWGNFNERRKYESKINFGIYTVYALTIAGILTQLKSNFITIDFVYGVSALSLILFIIHWMFIVGVYRANCKDRMCALYFEKIMQNLTQSDYSVDLLKILAKTQLRGTELPKARKNWNVQVQVLITFVLSVTAIIAAYFAYKLKG